MDDLNSHEVAALAAFARIPLSRIASHQQQCCSLAAESVIGGFLAMPDVGSALSMIPESIPWGYTAWPIHWCELAEFRSGDCGVHADLASYVMDRFGVPHRRCKAVISCPPSVVAHWYNTWAGHEGEARWIALPNLVYHEVIGVESRWWDPTELCWIGRVGASVSVGAVIALADIGSDWLLAP